MYSLLTKKLVPALSPEEAWHDVKMGYGSWDASRTRQTLLAIARNGRRESEPPATATTFVHR